MTKAEIRLFRRLAVAYFIAGMLFQIWIFSIYQMSPLPGYIGLWAQWAQWPRQVYAAWSSLGASATGALVLSAVTVAIRAEILPYWKREDVAESEPAEQTYTGV